jgi:hypothetical protein
MISGSGLCKPGAWHLVALACAFASPSAHAQLPDLSVRIQGPREALAGTDIGPRLRIVVANTGSRPARGTGSPGGGYIVDIFLTRNTMPEGLADYSEHYHDGVLLRGGRISNTVGLNTGARHGYSSSSGLPVDTPPGTYRLCARVDPGEAVAESNEGNNVDCTALKVTQLHVLPTPPSGLTVVPGDQPATQGVQRSVLSDGTLQLKYPDGTIRRRRPSGQIVVILPDGREQTVMMMQVQPADLPALPTGLSDWGTHINDELISILRGLLSEPEYQAYLLTEERKSFYELVEWRLRSIGFLTAAP